MSLADLLDDGQPEAGAAAGSGSAGVEPDEALEHPQPIRLRDAVAVVLDREDRVAVPLTRGQPHGAVRRPGRVVDEIADQLAEPQRVAEDTDRMYVADHLEIHAALTEPQYLGVDEIVEVDL